MIDKMSLFKRHNFVISHSA